MAEGSPFDAPNPADTGAALLRSVLDHQPDLICRFNLDTTLTYVNRSYAEAFGTQPDALIGRRFLDLIPAEYHPEILERLAGLTPARPVQSYEHESIGAGGQRIWQQWTDRAIFDEQGRLLTIQSTGRDATARYRTQRELEKQTRVQEILAELSATYINLPLDKVDATIEQSIATLGAFIGADRFFIFAYDFERGRARNTFEWISEGTPALIGQLTDFPLSVLGLWPTLHQQGQAVHVPDVDALPEDHPDHRLLAPHGIRSSLAVPMMDDGRCIGSLGMDSIRRHHFFTDAERRLLVVFAEMLVNIEKRRRNLNALEENRRFLADLIDTSLAIIAVKDIQGRYTLINRQWEQATGMSRREVLGRTDQLLFDPKTAQQFMGNDAEVLEHGRTLRVEETLPDGDQIRYFEAAKFPVRDHGGRIMGLCAMITETTDRRRAEAEKIARESAEAADRAKSAFLSNMSHEMRTPLNAIIGFAQILLQERGLEQRQAEQLQTIHRSAEHLLSLINDVLDFSKLEASRDHLHESDFSLRELMDEVTRMFQLRAGKRGLYLRTDLAPDVPDGLHGDGGKLRQILINLVGNAVKFTETGGIQMRVETTSDVVDAAESMQPRLRFEVQDTGPGVRPDQVNQIFESFGQGDAGRRTGGTGLGLSISRRLVELLGGELSVRSDVGKGACFVFDLPLKPARFELPRPTNAPRILGIESPSVALRVLAVDDQPDNLALIRALLEPVGFEVRTAESGAAALAEYRRRRPDAVLMDLRMLGMDGYETTRRLRQLPGGDQIPVIAVTASALSDERRGLAAAGLADYLRKPFRPAELLQMLARHLNIRYSTEPAATPPRIGPIAQPALLPAALRAELADMVRAGDMTTLTNQLHAVRKIDPDTATHLDALARQFDYTALLQALETHPRHDD